ncbi:MAG: ABC transporter substrate-binding protein [Chloroflexi bacterium]|nr:MAG: ABC transporter substrate-binding protein [Chloroflexota bacterium]
MHKRLLSGLLLVMFALLGSGVLAQDAVNFVDSCVSDFDPNVDYFPDKAEVEYAAGFSVEYHNNYKLVSVQPWPNAAEEEWQQYVLVQCGTPAPEDLADLPVIEVPVNRFVATATTMLPHLEAQGVLDRLVGIDTVLYTNTQAVIERFENGELVEVAPGGMGEINVEILIDLEPDVVMAQQFWSGGTTYSALEEAGVPFVVNSDYADTSPLGQAEWGKYISLFFNTEALANEVFDGVAQRYNELVELVSTVEERPTAIAGSPYEGTWYVAAGDSCLAQLLADAGADYIFADVEGTSVPMDFEAVLEQGIDSDYWVNINQFWATTDDMLAADERFAEFAAFQNGNLWNNNLIMNANGGNAYFEAGVANPDQLLADLVAIFHPDLLPDHEFIYYQQLTSSAAE